MTRLIKSSYNLKTFTMNLKTIAILVVAATITTSALADQAVSATTQLPSGVIVQTLKPGNGAKPTASNVVKVHYKGTLANGAEFDSSYSRGEPAEFPLSRVIPCWTQGVQTMRVGGKAKLTCPANTAYGERSSSKIPANSTLYFEVELISISR